MVYTIIKASIDGKWIDIVLDRPLNDGSTVDMLKVRKLLYPHEVLSERTVIVGRTVVYNKESEFERLVHTEDLRRIDTADIINCLPQNNMMYKDSGLWGIYVEEGESLIIEQDSREPFRDFIIRYVLHLRSTLNYEQREEMETDLCVL